MLQLIRRLQCLLRLYNNLGCERKLSTNLISYSSTPCYVASNNIAYSDNKNVDKKGISVGSLIIFLHVS